MVILLNVSWVTKVIASESFNKKKKKEEEREKTFISFLLLNRVHWGR